MDYSWFGAIEVTYLYTWISTLNSSEKAVISNSSLHVLNFLIDHRNDQNHLL